MHHKTSLAKITIAIPLLAALPVMLKAQATPAQPDPDKEETVELSPFVVDASEGQESYQATTTLAGSRVRTDLRDLGSAITVVTKKLMTDIGATDSGSLLQYTTNTEVGGLGGNFSGLGNGSVISEAGKLLRPSNNTRVRGLDAADNTRDYFLTDIPWDGYNVDRVELQRGANSILFGMGSPAGIINTGLATASYKTGGKFENRISTHGSMRNLADYNLAILKNELALRVIALDNDTRYQQKPAYSHDRRAFAALKYEPGFLKIEGARTTLTANFEAGKVTANRPRMTPPVDGISSFFTFLNKQLNDSAQADNGTGIRTGSGDPVYKAATDNYLARSFGTGLVLRYDANSPTPTSSTVATINNPANIGGLPFYRSNASQTLSYIGSMSGNFPASVAARFPGGPSGVYKDQSITDRSAFDYFNHLIDGNTKKEWQDWTAFNVTLAQTFFHNRLGFQGVVDRQHYVEGQETLLDAGTSGSPTLVVDTNSTVITGLTKVGGLPNPNGGRVTTATGTGENGNQSNDITRTSKRLTGTADLRAEDFMAKGLAQKLLGHHVVTGLLSEDETDWRNQQWARFAGGIGPDSLSVLTGDMSPGINNGARVISLVNYLSGSLLNANGIANSHIKPLDASILPRSGLIGATYFDTRWNKPGVDPSAAWVNPLNGLTQRQSDNPANYVGWTNATVRVLNADDGDKAALTYGDSKTNLVVKSSALTYQAFLYDDTLVGTFGWRRDRIHNRAGSGAKSPVDGHVSPEYDYNPASDRSLSGTTKSWSLVLHTPKELRQKIPGGLDLSVFYNRSMNFQASAPRADFMGNILPNQKGRTTDYGIALDTLDGKLSLKVTWYKTTVENANLGGESLLGGSAWFLRQGEIWGTMVAAQSIAGLTNQSIATPGWAWDWASNDLGFPAGTWPRPASASAIDQKQLAAAQAWLSGMMPQKFWDEYGYAINAEQVKNGDFSSLLNGNTLHYTWDWQPAYNGNLKSTGSGPVVTVNTESKGVEYELAAQPIRNWNIAFNASKTSATRKDLASTVENYIKSAYAKYSGPAGDLRLWGPGSSTIRDWGFMPMIYYPYLFLKSGEGSQAAEIRPWRFNVMTSYTFDSGALKGFYVGGAERWQQGQIIGYGITKDNTGNWNLDVKKPYHGKSEASFDLWFGYSRKLTKKIDWRGQINLTSVGQKNRLIPISVQPDGTPATFRIAEGMGWQFTNTFSF
ncbi:TonB-dependent receptor plug domain-containing protein [Nibricoccus sp. IMCC34717]|uniref:TonB-dependent receptor plug domain-containing protein n=1 Tax=Nibricoccus sp. IMCC34717 TaxID=3034021 RepID=UPI00384B9CD1